MDYLIRAHEFINLHGVASLIIGIIWVAFICKVIIWVLGMAGVRFSPSNFFVVLVTNLTDPVQAPFKRLLPPVGMIDLSFLAGWFTIQILGTLITQSLPLGW